MKSIDADHLVSLGTIGSGQCGTGGDEYQDVHASEIDLCEYHDYEAEPDPRRPVERPRGAPAAVRRARQAAVPRRGSASSPTEAGRHLRRAGVMAAKLDGQFGAGVMGVLAWNWRDDDHGGSSLSGYEIGPGDPALAVLGAY